MGNGVLCCLFLMSRAIVGRTCNCTSPAALLISFCWKSVRRILYSFGATVSPCSLLFCLPVWANICMCDDLWPKLFGVPGLLTATVCRGLLVLANPGSAAFGVSRLVGMGEPFARYPSDGTTGTDKVALQVFWESIVVLIQGRFCVIETTV